MLLNVVWGQMSFDIQLKILLAVTKCSLGLSLTVFEVAEEDEHFISVAFKLMRHSVFQCCADKIKIRQIP